MKLSDTIERINVPKFRTGALYKIFVSIINLLLDFYVAIPNVDRDSELKPNMLDTLVLCMWALM